MTSAALILFLAFISMASGPETDVKMLATGLAAGILLDATVIRALIVPAVISLMGRWNWWLPTLAGPAASGPALAATTGGGERSRVARRGPGACPRRPAPSRLVLRNKSGARRLSPRRAPLKPGGWRGRLETSSDD